MELVDEQDVRRAEQALVDKLSSIWRNCQVLPHPGVRMLGVLHDHDGVLDADAELTILVEAWLIRNDHTLSELKRVAAADTVGPLVAVRVRSNAVARAMAIVKAGGPEALPGQNVHVASCNFSAFGPYDPLQTERAEQDSSVHLLLECSGFASSEVRRPGDVDRAVEVLATRVEQIDLIVVHFHGSVLLSLVVDHCTVGSNRTDRGEGWTAMMLTMSSQLVEDSGSLIFV